MTASPLRVMIDARMLIGRFSGVARVVTRLVDELCRRGDVSVVALCGREPFAAWAGRDDVEVVTTTFGRRDRTPMRRHLWEETHLRRLICRAGVDLYHATWNTGVPRRCPVATVLTVHDLIPWRHPTEHFATTAQRFFHRRAVRVGIQRAHAVTTVSDYVRGQVLEAFPVDAGRIVTVPNGADPGRSECRESARAEALGSQRYVLYVGGHERRKNVAAAFEAVGAFWDRDDCGNRHVEFRLTGDRGSLCPAAEVALRRLPSDARVRFLGKPDDAELSRQYAGASALLMLSTDEGFGLPVLEAMGHGCPVIAARNASLPEVVGDAGILVDAARSGEVARAIERLMTDTLLRADLVDRGLARAREFSWRSTADAMVGVYRAAMNRQCHGETRTMSARPFSGVGADGDSRLVGSAVRTAPFD